MNIDQLVVWTFSLLSNSHVRHIAKYTIKTKRTRQIQIDYKTKQTFHTLVGTTFGKSKMMIPYHTGVPGSYPSFVYESCDLHTYMEKEYPIHGIFFPSIQTRWVFSPSQFFLELNRSLSLTHK